MIQHSSLVLQFDEALHSQLEDRVLSVEKNNDRRVRLQEDRSLIQNLSSGEEIVKYIRQKHEGLADPDLFRKVLSMQEEACPAIVKRYVTTGQDEYVDASFRILAKADSQYTDQLYEAYSDIRNPYAQATACLLFGEHSMKKAIPLLMEEYERFVRVFPNESFNESPLFSLYLICGQEIL